MSPSLTEQCVQAIEWLVNGLVADSTASMNERGSTVRQNADNARSANQLTMGASTVAAQGGDVVAQVGEAVTQMDQATQPRSHPGRRPTRRYGIGSGLGKLPSAAESLS